MLIAKVIIIVLCSQGIFNKKTINVLGPGTVINLESAVKELDELRSSGISIGVDNYRISNRAIISFPFHTLQDEYEEERLENQMFGSTKQGIAPVYADKYMKYGIQIGTLYYPDYLREQIKRVLELKNKIFSGVYKKPSLDSEKIFKWAMEFGEILKPFICDTIQLFNEAAKGNKVILLEAQLGTLRDIHYGIYPYTTSSSPLAAFSYIGAGFFTHESPMIIGVMKAFSTCVGQGPFVTEMEESLADKLREISLEYGAATGRPRRIGHYDAVASRFGAMIQNANEIAMTKLDSLSGQSNLKICTHYMIGDQAIDYFPITPELITAQPKYIDLPGWDEDITKIRRYDDLPHNAKNYVETIEKLIGFPIKYISVGPERDALIIR